jgi:hypothetical protein
VEVLYKVIASHIKQIFQAVENRIPSRERVYGDAHVIASCSTAVPIPSGLQSSAE